MAFQTFTFDLELQPGGAPPVIYASAGDIGRPFTASLYWNGEAWTATGTTAKIRGKKPDKTVFDYTATVDGSSVTFATTEQMTIISGPVECELVFFEGSNVVATANFILVVEESPFDPNAISESEVTGLNAMIQAATPEAVDDWFETEAPSSTVFTNAVNDAVSDYADTEGLNLTRGTNGVMRLGSTAATGTAGKITGFSVYDESGSANGVSKYDFTELYNLNAMTAYRDVISEFEFGTIADGTYNSTTARIRTKQNTLPYVRKGSMVIITNNFDRAISFNIWLYKSAQATATVLINHIDNWSTLLAVGDTKTIIIEQDCYVAFQVKKQGDVTMTSDDLATAQNDFIIRQFYPIENDDTYPVFDNRFETGETGNAHLPFKNFCVGGMSNGALVSNKFRVASNTIFQYDYPIVLKVESGFRIGVHFMNDDETFNSDPGWITSSRVIPANQKFKLVISANPDTTTELSMSDIETFVSKVSFSSLFAYEAAANFQREELTDEEKGLAYGFTWMVYNGAIAKSNTGTASSTATPLYLPKGTIISIDDSLYKFRVVAEKDGELVLSSNTWRDNLYAYVLEQACNCYICIDDVAATGIPTEEIAPHLHISVPNGIDYVREIDERLVKVESDTKERDYATEGEAVNTKKQTYDVSLMSVQSTPVAEIDGVTANQGMTICNGVIFQLFSNDKVELIDLETGSSIGILTITSDHGDTIDFSNEYYADGDEFPLAYITADTTPAKVYVNRITRTGCTLVKTYTFPADKTGYYAGHTLDPVNKILYQVGYTENSFNTDPNGTNNMIVSKWDLKNVTDNGDNVYTPAFVSSFTIPFIYTVQGQAFFDGKIVCVSSYSGTPPTHIYFIDPAAERICTVMSEFPSGVSNAEGEGVAFIEEDGKYNMVIKTNNVSYWKVIFS